jgi:excisionase family DNA binding protein
MPERWLSVKEIAEHLGVSKESIYNWVNEGKIPAHKIGRFWKFKISEVDESVTKNNTRNDQSKEANK